MEHMRRIAYETVLRACSFGSLAIFCVMIGLSFQPRAAFQAGGFLTLLMTAILVLKAHEARTKNYRKTEMWLYLAKEHRPPEAQAQWATSKNVERKDVKNPLTQAARTRWSRAARSSVVAPPRLMP